ncbi:MAG: GNAT family N-acetyltransferase [Beijerinckiaceae bacterium]
MGPAPMSLAAPETARTVQPADVAAAATAAHPPFTIGLHADPAAVLDAWAELEALAPASFYQTRRFLLPWIATVGKAGGVEPAFILVRGQTGSPLALFPFGLKRRRGLAALEFLGGRDSNANLPLVRPGAQLPPDTLTAILREAARLTGADFVHLKNQPLTWNGWTNPLAQLPAQASPSQCHSTALDADPEIFLKRQLSKDARKKLRGKQRKLEELGSLLHTIARTADEARHILEAFYAQKLQRFDDKNIDAGFDAAHYRSFFEQCCLPGQDGAAPALELHALALNGKVLATYAGGVHNGRFHGLFNSFDTDPDIARHSPGDLLLKMLVEAKCREGLHTLDLGIGEARYKSTWCDTAEPLADVALAFTAKGHAARLAVSLLQSAKRNIKQSAWAWPLWLKLRERMRRK